MAVAGPEDDEWTAGTQTAAAASTPDPEPRRLTECIQHSQSCDTAGGYYDVTATIDETVVRDVDKLPLQRDFSRAFESTRVPATPPSPVPGASAPRALLRERED